MAKKKSSGNPGGTVAVCTKLAQPVAEELGLILWDVRFVKEGATWYLRYIIDKEEGVSIDDCVELSRRLNPLLDEADPIPQAYCVEVSSPGLNRELVKPAHFAAFEGWPVMVSGNRRRYPVACPRGICRRPFAGRRGLGRTG